VEQKGAAVIPARANGFSNCEFSGSTVSGTTEGNIAAVPYFIDMTVGEMLLSNVSMNGDPTTAFVHVGAGVGLNALRMSNVTPNKPAKLLFDERPGSLYGYGSIPLTPAVSDVAPIVSVNRPIWILADGATNGITYAAVPIPADAQDRLPVTVRVTWYSDSATGNAQLVAGLRSLAVTGEDITVGQTDVAATVTVPATANRTTTTTFTSPTVTATPGGRLIALWLRRLGTDAADTTTGGIRILSAELLYRRAL
jgi:hypothetical protein